MLDEEKKAIEFVKSELQDEKIARNDYQSLTGLYGNLEIEIVLNLIEKQSKEIEELKEKNIQVAHGGRRFNTEGIILKDYISKEKIREKIEKLKKEGDYRDIYNPTGRVHFMKEETDYKIEILQELLEEE